MEMDEGHVTKRMLNLTLEIIYLLTGEKYIAFKLCDGLVISSLMETHNSVPRKNNNNLQKVTSEIIELLTGEVPIGCPDVTMRFSMEEDYIEGHKDGRMEHQPSLPTSDGSSTRTFAERCAGLYSQDSTEEEHTMSQSCQNGNSIVVMKEEEDEMYVGSGQPCKEEESHPEISTNTRRTHVKAEEEEEKYVKIKEEDISAEFSTDVKYIRSNPDMHPMISADGEIGDDITSDSSEERPVAPNLHPAPHSADPSRDPSIHGRRFPDLPHQSRPVSHHTAQRGRDAFPCSECGECFTQRAELITHQKDHKAEKPYSCSECGKCFSWKSYLTKHQELHEREKRHEKSLNLFQVNTREERPDGQSILSPEGEMEEGITFHSSKGNLFTSNLQSAPSSADPADYRTPAGSFPGHSSPVAHHATYEGDYVFPCSECGKCFTLRGELALHKRVHEGEKPYSCSECGRGFSQKRYLANHQRLHTGEKPYSCSECGKCFPLKNYLISHQTVHKGEKPHSCLVCGKSFARKSDLVIHQRTHTGKKPFSCTECGKCFFRRVDLTIHLRTHTGERPFSCSECGKSFNQLSSLTLHQVTHTREKAYSCPECGKCFARKSDICRHQRTHSQQ